MSRAPIQAPERKEDRLGATERGPADTTYQFLSGHAAVGSYLYEKIP